MNRVTENSPLNRSDTSLNEVLVERPDNIAETAKTLFGNNYALLQQKYQDLTKSNFEAKVIFGGCLVGEFVLAGVGATLSISYGIKELIGLFGCIGGVTAAVASLFSAVGGLCTLRKIDNTLENTTMFFSGAHTIVSFKLAFDDFKDAPDISKVNKVFAKFNNIKREGYWLDYMYLNKFENRNLRTVVRDREMNMLGDVGKLFLMHDVVKLLPNEFVKGNLTSEAFVITPVPWAKMGISIPNLKALIKFNELIKSEREVNIGKKAVRIFDKSFDFAVQFKKI